MPSTKIKTIYAREILDSRGEPTIETKIILQDGSMGTASMPSGASTGKFEAWELRDNDQSRYQGKGVLKACQNVNKEITSALKDQDVLNQSKIDETLIALDGTANKSRLGANAILSVSLAAARAAAAVQSLELWTWIRQLHNYDSKTHQDQKIKSLANGFPLPCFNMIEGGKHADNKLSLQEFWALPISAPNFKEAVRMGSEVFHSLKNLCKEKGYYSGVGDEGGIAPNLESNSEAIELLIEAINKAGYKINSDFRLGLDAAASSFYENGNYILHAEELSLTSDQIVALYNDWIDKYPIAAIEDGLAEEDWEGWRHLNSRVGDKVQIVGDDLLVTNIKRLEEAVQKKSANAILIKPNQIGTLTETLACIKFAQSHSFGVIISHRSGETCDSFIADLAIGTKADEIKMGSLNRGERLAKYNRIMEIEG